MKPNLIATPIVDKNGKPTTVRKRSITLANRDSLLLPAPVMPHGKGIEEIRTDLSTMVSRLSPRRPRAQLIQKNLSRYPVRLLKRLHAKMFDEQRMTGALSELIGRGESPEFISEYLRFSPELETSNFITVDRMIRGLHRYKAFRGHTDFAETDELTQARCLALLHVIEAMIDSNANRGDLLPVEFGPERADCFIRDRPLVSMLMERPEDGKRIAAIISERGTIDTELITTMLDPEAPALAEGIL